VIVWRIANRATLEGDGGLRASGRWHGKGRRIVYTSISAATALLEVLVHLEVEPGGLPANFKLMRIEVPDEVTVTEITLASLPPDWRSRQDVTRALGDAWLARAETAALRVPSALISVEHNVLLNPAHPQHAVLRLLSIEEHAFDSRLL
jgi:RES domain-containing protein